MFKNRFILVIGVLALLLVTMAVTYPRTNASLAASDFHQRHPEWQWASGVQNAVIPVTGISAAPDYYQRHPEFGIQVSTMLAASDYFMRHPELTESAKPIDLTDYFFRQR
jgi:hypothetical protein